MRISDWSSDVCSSDLLGARVSLLEMHRVLGRDDPEIVAFARRQLAADGVEIHEGIAISRVARDGNAIAVTLEKDGMTTTLRSEEHTSELQSLMRISYAVFCLKKKKKRPLTHNANTHTRKI